MPPDEVPVSFAFPAALSERQLLLQAGASLGSADLAALAVVERLGPLDDDEVAGASRLSPTTAAAALERLEGLKLVVRLPGDPSLFVARTDG
jgi:DNA-binding MarR family transcriptional regulator